MAFRLTQWFISFTVFLIVLLVIVWSAVHLGQKKQNVTDIVLIFFKANDYPRKLLYSTEFDLTSPVVETTDTTTEVFSPRLHNTRSAKDGYTLVSNGSDVAERSNNSDYTPQMQPL
ncbi:PREDICTED: uncharacterized protein LOC105153837 [Acromyrmex echinatior]|uniref:uncharacterized protein LOC105153837 n=1 Tax=Acromyrmex echinatior TaxID=103372 RepID=UPI000580E03E|nr:PREDICTED: uncharacterized protein LOC105153837 [Acromyrmex echinatior]